MMGARTIDDVHAGSSSVEATAAQPSAAKRCKVTSTPTVITFKAEGSPVQVQLLSSHTLYNLVDVLLQACELVPGEEAYSHMWNVTINGKMYESGDFPCRSDHRAEETTIAVDLNTVYPNFNKWAFNDDVMKIDMNLGQGGKKQVFGWCDLDNGEGIRQMLLLPTKYTSLELYLHALNHATKFSYSKMSDGYPCNNWYSMVIVQAHDTDKKRHKYLSETIPGFCNAKILPTRADLPALASIFPRVSTLLGCDKKQKKVPKGWFTYKKRVLSVYTGGCEKGRQGMGPPGTAFEGAGIYIPLEKALVQMRVNITSLHHLLETLEGMLQTLG